MFPQNVKEILSSCPVGSAPSSAALPVSLDLTLQNNVRSVMWAVEPVMGHHHQTALHAQTPIT